MGEIKLDTHNYRIHDDRNLKLIKKSLKECGAARSIAIDAEGEIIAGNATYKTAQELGIPVKIIKTDGNELIAVQRTDLSTKDKKRKKLALMDNSTSDKVAWDIDTLSADFDLGELPELGIEDLPEIAQLEPEITEDEVPNDEEVETRCKRGDIWQLGDHRLMCGDSTVITDVEKLMNGEKADMVFTDPPYNVAYKGGMQIKKGQIESNGKKQIKNDEMSYECFYNFLTDSFLNLKSFTKDKSAMYIFYAHSQTRAFINALYEVGLKQRSVIIWHKTSGGFGDFMAQYMNAYEPCLYVSNGESVNWYGPSNEKTVWEIDKEKVCNLHPTMKPIAVVSRAIKNSSKTNALVLDLFGGSGSTLIACEQLKRKCYMCELDEHYCSVIIQRYINLKGNAEDVFLLNQDGTKTKYEDVINAKGRKAA